MHVNYSERRIFFRFFNFGVLELFASEPLSPPATHPIFLSSASSAARLVVSRLHRQAEAGGR